MSNIQRVLMPLFASLFFLGFTGCTSKDKVLSVAPETQKAADHLEEEINARMTKAHHHISPEKFEELQEVHNDIEAMAMDGHVFDNEVERKISESRSLLNRIDKDVEVAQFHLPRVLNARIGAIKEGAIDSDYFKEAEEDFRELGEEIEEGDINEIIAQRDEVIKNYYRAESSVIQNRELAKARANMEKIQDHEMADDFESMIKTTERKIQKAVETIAKNKDDKSIYQPSVQEANDSTEILLARMETGRMIKSSTPQELSLILENDLAAISNPLTNNSLQKKNYNEKISFLKKEASTAVMSSHSEAQPSGDPLPERKLAEK